MRHFCDICLRDIKSKSNYSHLKPKSHKEFDKYKPLIVLIVSLKNVDIKDAEEILNLDMKDNNKKFNHYLSKGEFKLVFNINQDCK